MMNIRELPLELKTAAKDTLCEEENRLIDDVKYILEWLKKQPHLNVRIEAQWIVSFLRGCKHSLERTKEKLDAYYTIRTHWSEIFLNRDPDDKKIQKILDVGTYLPLPVADKPDGPRVILVRGAIYDPKQFTFEDVLQVFFMIMDIQLLEDDRLNIAGQDTVLDVSGGRLDRASQFTPALIKKTVTCFQDGYPIKTKSLHFINVTPTFDTIFSIFKRFMNPKLRERIIVHKNIEDLYKYIPKCVLPSDYGGDAPSVKDLTDEWKRKIMTRRNWFIEDAKFRVDESKRPGKPITDSDLFGINGSFRKLDID